MERVEEKGNRLGHLNRATLTLPYYGEEVGAHRNINQPTHVEVSGDIADDGMVERRRALLRLDAFGSESPQGGGAAKGV